MLEKDEFELLVEIRDLLKRIVEAVDAIERDQ